MLPRSGAGTRRQSSNAAFAFCTARSTSAAVERGNVPSTSPFAGAIVSNVCPAIMAVRLLRGGGVGECPRDARTAAVTREPALLELGARQLVPAVGVVLAAVDDHRHVRI